MPEPESDHHSERKVVYETNTVVTSGPGQHLAAWIIIGVIAIALIAYILVKIS